MTVEIELNRLPDLSERDDKALQFSTIPYLAEPCSYDQFFTNYLLDNRPCLLGNWATHSWPCLSDWRGKSGPRLDHILTLVGSDARVPVTNCDNR